MSKAAVKIEELMALLTHDDRLTDALAWLDGQQQAMLDNVLAWSRVNSGSGNLDGLADMEELIVDAVQQLDADLEFIQLAPRERVGADGQVEELPAGRCMLVKSRSRANKRVLMTGHTDTVFPKESAFQEPVFLDDNTLNGPGVTDMKGGILVMLYALRAAEKAGLADRFAYEVLLSPDEETGSLGSAPLLAAAAKRADIGLTYEPALADGTLVGQRKGSGNFTVVVRGKAAHAGREFHVGRNAVVKLAEITADLAALTGGRPGLTLNPAVVSGGQAPNVVPELAKLAFNVRLEAREDQAWIEQAVAGVIEKHRAAEGFEIELHGGITRPPKIITPANQLLMDRIQSCGALLGLDINYVSTGGVCEGNNLAASGLPNVDTLGVRGGAIHSEQEFLLVDSLSERAKLSTVILAAFATGAMDDVIAAKRAEKHD